MIDRGVCGSLLIGINVVFSLTCLAGQVTLDGSFGTSGTLTGPNYGIPASVGKTVGNNLFHSFGQFNLSNGDTATFSGPNNIQNILSRVTGGNPSSIDGTIQSTIPGANFFLINPSGILFGQHAMVDVSGSFIATTADYVKLADGARFVSKNPTTADDVLLTSAAPAAFGFLGPAPSPISVVGGDAFAGEPPSVITAAEEKSITLVGGDIEIRNGQLNAPSGRVNLVAISSPGELSLDPSDLSFRADTANFSQLASVTITEASVINVAGVVRGGRVFATAQDLNLGIAAQIYADNSGPEPGLGVELIARNSLTMDGALVNALAFGDGLGGSIQLKAPSIRLQNGASIATDTTSGTTGNAGDIKIDGEMIDILNGSSVTAGSSGTAAGGNIELTASSIHVDGQGSPTTISSSSFGGKAGDIIIHAGSLEIADFGNVEADTSSSLPGGNIDVTVDSLTILHNASLAVSTSGPADAGTIHVVASSVRCDGAGTIGAVHFEGIEAQSTSLASGKGGDIFIESGSLDMINGAQISTSTDPGTTGDAGNIQVSASTLMIQDGGSIQSAATGTGNAGSISLDLSKQLLLHNNSSVSVSASQSDAGAIEIQAGSHVTLDHSSIAASAGVDGGSIKLQARDLVYLFKSQVVASAGNDGGNVTIDPHVVALNQSQITANALQNNAGNINIVSDFFLNSDSLIQARTPNQFAFQGSVNIAAPDTELSGSLIPLSVPLADAESKLRERCAVRLPGGISSFIVVGRGGIPIDPEGFKPSLELKGR